MKEIRFFVRNRGAGYSIEKTFEPIFHLFENSTDYNIKIFHVPCLHADFISLIRNIYYVWKNRSKNGINHVTGDIHYTMIGLIGTKSVLTIHDLVLLHNTKNIIKRSIYKLFWFRIPCKLANRIICISETTKNELLKEQLAKKGNVDVIYNSLEHIFQYNHKVLNLKDPIILHIGTNWNKNLDKVIAALNGIKCRLTIIGKVDDRIKQELRENNTNYTILQDLSDEEVYRQYCDCDIVSFPSLFEGFGMPLIEGQSTGRPVLTSNINPLIEISGGAAIFVDPSSIKSIRNGFLKILEGKVDVTKIISDGLKNSKKFAPENAYKKYVIVYESLVRR